MYSYVTSGTILGIHGSMIQVEADVSDGLPCFHMVGYLSGEVRESGERIRTAIRNSGIAMPPKKVVINLSPADIRKGGSGFDVPIAVAMLISLGCIEQEAVKDVVFVGELGLNGTVLPMNGVLPLADAAKQEGFKYFVAPYDNCNEAASVKGISVIGIHSLKELIEIFRESDQLPVHCYVPQKIDSTFMNQLECDFKDLKGQPLVRRAMEVAASGMHNILMTGPPGAGKTMAAKCLTGILPEMTPDESMEVTKVYSVRGLLREQEGLIRKRPFRAPHHTVSTNSLIGGGSVPKPGEVSLANHGVLFLDELPEFSKNAIEVLRQPLEDRRVLVSRVRASYEYPANTMLVAAMNPCPCGSYPDRNYCNCTSRQIQMYQGRISRAILDRIDLQIQIRPVLYSDIIRKESEESSASIRERVCAVHEIQQKRYCKENYRFNSQLDSDGVKRYCQISKDDEVFMKDIFEKRQLSARGFHRILKVARTLADMEQEENICNRHLMEAIAYKMWDYSHSMDMEQEVQ